MVRNLYPFRQIQHSVSGRLDSCHNSLCMVDDKLGPLKKRKYEALTDRILGHRIECPVRITLFQVSLLSVPRAASR
jgi:hypothetical protein